MKKHSIFVSILIFLMLFSCSQEGSLYDTGEIFTESVSDGAMLKSGDIVNLSLYEEGERASDVQVLIQNAVGEEIANVILSPDLLKSSTLPIELPADLEPGLYYFLVYVYEQNVLLYEDLRHFYISDGVLDILSLETYPPGIRPGDRISARIKLENTSSLDPWLRWSLDEQVFLEGFLSDIGVSSQFDVPEESGVYSLALEVFPVEPEEGHISILQRYSDLFVRSPEEDDLPWGHSEERVYHYFIDFSQDLSNRMNPDSTVEVLGDPQIYSTSEFSGILFNEDDGLIFDEYAIPLNEDGTADDFRLHMTFAYDTLPDEGLYNVFWTGDENSYITLRYIAESQEFFTEFRAYSRSYHSSFVAEESNSLQIMELELDYSSHQGTAQLKWKNYGSLLAEGSGFPIFPLEQGQTVIGSNHVIPGLPMVWYSLDVSTRKEMDESLLYDLAPNADAPQQTLLFEKGNDSSGLLSLQTPDIGDGLGSIELELSSDAHGDWTLLLRDSEGVLFYSLTPDSLVDDSDMEGPISLSFSNDQRGFYLSSSLEPSISGPFEKQDFLNIEITSDSETSTALDEILKIHLFRD